MSYELFSKTSCASPSSIFAEAKITRNRDAFLRFADFSLSAKWCARIIYVRILRVVVGADPYRDMAFCRKLRLNILRSNLNRQNENL